MRLKMPNIERTPKRAEEKIDDRCCLLSIYPRRDVCIAVTLFSKIRCIRTKVHNTTSVSIEFEKVWV